MIDTKIRVWIVKKQLRAKYEYSWHKSPTTLTKADRTIFLKLKSKCHPAMKYKKLLKQHGVPFTKTVICEEREDYYHFQSI